jgi:hypothetical protein
MSKNPAVTTVRGKDSALGWEAKRSKTSNFPRKYELNYVAKSSFTLVLLIPCLVCHVNGTATLGNSTCPVFPSDHVWNTPIDCLPVHSNSAAFINSIGTTTGLHPDFGSGTYAGQPIGIPYITVSASQTKYPVTFDYYSESDHGLYAIPLNAPIEGGSSSTGDRHVLSVDADNCILYELYRAFPDTSTSSWTAISGAIFNLTAYGLRPETWTSADAAGLPIFPGLVRYEEILKGSIDHALRFTVQNTRNSYVWPARHKASSLTGLEYPSMGQRFRLKSSFDISGFSPTNQIILRALKKYGMMVADNGSNWFLSGVPDERWNNDDLHNLQTLVKGSNFEAVDTSSLVIDGNSGKAKQLCIANPSKPVASKPIPVNLPLAAPVTKPAAPIPKPAAPFRKPVVPVPRGPVCVSSGGACSISSACCSKVCKSNKRCK